MLTKAKSTSQEKEWFAVKNFIQIMDQTSLSLEKQNAKTCFH